MMRSRLIEAWFRLRASFRRRRLERDLDDEIAFHIAMRQDAVAAARASTPDANREAHRRFGSVTGVKERMREMWTFPSVESIWQDAVYATRSLRRQPGFTAVVLLVLGAAIGLNTSLFTVSAGLLLRPWPGITDPSRVVALYLPQSTGPAAGRMGFSIADYRFLAAHTAALQSVAVMSPDSEVRLGAEGAAGLALMVSANFFDVLGLAMARGRGFHADEDRPGNPLPVAVLAHPFWQSRLGGDPDIVGKRLRVNDVEFTVVGVASREWASSEPSFGVNDEAQSRTLVAGISDALANLPAVRFGFASLEPFSLFRNATVVHLPGRSTDDPQMMSYLGVTPGYFGVLGIPIVAGRNFTAADTGTSVVLINEQMASSYWPNTNALGQTFVTGRSQSHEIVGIVRNVRTNTLEDIQPLFYQPLSGGGAVPKLLLHANGPAGFDLIASTVSRIDSRVRVQRTTLSTILATRLESSRWGPLLAGILGAFALALASVGMFGVFAYAVRQRTREIGIRMALGAQPRAVVRLVLAGHSRVVVVGLLLGLLGGVAASIVLRHSLHGLSPFDPIAYLGVAALLAGAALMASYVPARRATRIDPIEALRCD